MEYTTRKTNSKFRVPATIIISLSVGFFLLFLIFSTDNVYDVQESDLATISISYAIDRDSSVEIVQEAKVQAEMSIEATSTTNAEYYDMEVPYTLTCGEIGGLLSGTGTDRYTGKTYTLPSYVKEIHIGDAVSRETSPSYMTTLFSSTSKQHKVAELWISEGQAMSKDIPTMGTLYGRYMSAIQPYFYSSASAFWGVNDCIGQYFDVVLTDGTVIPFIVIDQNAKEHTNKDTNDAPSNYWPTGKLLKTEYKYLFNSGSGNCLELIGNEGCVSDFKDFYKLGSENHIAYYRMYNKKVL